MTPRGASLNYASLLAEDASLELSTSLMPRDSLQMDVPLECSLPVAQSIVGDWNQQVQTMHQRTLLQRLRLAIVFFFTALAWGSSLLFINKCLPKLDPCSIGLMRTSIALCFLLAYHAWQSFAPWGTTEVSRDLYRKDLILSFTSRKTVFQMAVLGFILSGTSSTLTAVSEIHISGGLASIILMLEPLVCPFLALLLPADKRTEVVDRFTVAGVIIGLIGTGLSIYPSVGDGDDSSHIFSICMCILGSLGFAVGTVTGQAFASKRPVFHRVTGQLLFGMLFLLPVTSILRSQGVFSDWSGSQPITYIAHVGYEPWLWLLALASVCTIGSWAGFYILLTEIGSLTATVNFLIPPVSIFLGAAFHDEWTGVSTGDKLFEVGGMLVVLCGVGLVIYSAERASAAKAQAAEQERVVSSALGRRSPETVLEEPLFEMDRS